MEERNGGQLILNTPFERLVADVKRINKEHEKRVMREFEKNKEVEIVHQTFKKIFLSVMSVFFFLRKEVGMNKREITIDEFEIAREYLQKTAQKQVDKLRVINWLIDCLGIKTSWRYYLDNGHFSLHRTPFGEWYEFHPLNNFFDFDPFGVYEKKYSVPPNMQELIIQIYAKQMQSVSSDCVI